MQQNRVVHCNFWRAEGEGDFFSCILFFSHFKIPVLFISVLMFMICMLCGNHKAVDLFVFLLWRPYCILPNEVQFWVWENSINPCRNRSKEYSEIKCQWTQRWVTSLPGFSCLWRDLWEYFLKIVLVLLKNFMIISSVNYSLSGGEYLAMSGDLCVSCKW